MPNPIPLQPGQYFHIYNRGKVPPGTGRCNNGETLFREQRNTPYFLRLYANYIEPVAETYPYCLLKNHFHLLVWIKDPEEWQSCL